MAEHPDYVKCISRTMEASAALSWCGRRTIGLFTFQGLDHAAENNLQRGRLVPCPECVEAAVAALRTAGVAPTGEARPLWDANNPRDGYVTDVEWAARRTAKPDTSDERLRAALDVVLRWLTPDGIDSGAAMVEISGLVDPLPAGVAPTGEGQP